MRRFPRAPLAFALALAASTLFPCACVDGGTKLGALPSLTLDLYLSTTGGSGQAPTNTGFGSGMLTLVPTDPAVCITISSHTQAMLNGSALNLTSDGGTSSDQSGRKYCVANQYDGAGAPLGGDATLTLSDDTATFRVVAAGGLEPGAVTLVSPADGVMHFGQTVVEIGIPAHGRAVTYANVGFVVAGASMASFFAEIQNTYAPLSISGEVLTFAVPALLGIDGTGATGAGRLLVNLQFADDVTTCDGPVSCGVFTGMVETLDATLAN